MPANPSAVIVGYARSPFTLANKGALAQTRPDDIAAQVVRELVKRVGLNPRHIEDLAMGCDFLLAEKGATFGAYEMRHGFPAAVCTPILARLVGPRLGLEFALFGEPISAGRLHAAGLVNRLAEDAADLARQEAAFVGHLAKLDPRAVKLTRDTFRASEQMPLDNALDMGRQLNQLVASLGGFARAGQKLAKPKA